MPSTTQQLDRNGRLARNQIRGVYAGRMFGHRFNIPAFTRVLFWDGPTEEYIFTDPSVNRIDTISSSEITDTGQILIDGLDENWMTVQQIVTLDGRNKVGLTTDLIRFNFAQSLKNLDGDVYVYEDTAITNGVPDDLSKVKGYIDADNNITKQLFFSVPSGNIINIKRVVLYCVPGAQCCVTIDLFTKFFGQSDVLAYKTPIVQGGSTFIDLEVSSTATFPEKSDLYAYISTTSPNSSVTSITEYEIIRN